LYLGILVYLVLHFTLCMPVFLPLQLTVLFWLLVCYYLLQYYNMITLSCYFTAF